MAKILVVDDSRLTRRIVVAALEGAGHECVQAGNGEEGLAAYREHTPDCVVTDLLMPVMDGFGLAEAVREVDADAPVIVVSADIQQSSLERCESLGVAAMLNKPAKPDVIVESVERAINARPAVEA